MLDAGIALGLERAGAAALEESTANILRMQAIDTGALQNSGFLATPDHDGRGEAKEAAKAAAGKGGDSLEFAPSSSDPGDGEIVVGYPLDYAQHVHDGYLAPRAERLKKARDRKSGKGAYRKDGRVATVVEGRPFLKDAMETVAGELAEIVGGAVKEKLGG